MSQRFEGTGRRYELDAKPDPLLALNRLIPWETFRSKLRSALEEAGQRDPEARKSPAGRKPWDEVLMFKVLGALMRSTTSRTTMWNI